MNLKSIINYFTPTSILDIGANTGWFYLLCRECFPDAKYCLIEANPECEANLKSLQVEYHISLLTNAVKTVNFYTTKDSPTTTGASIYKENSKFFTDENLVITEYQSTTLDLLFQNRTFDLIKMDVQGAELDIIKGGLNTLANTKGVLLELSCIPYNDGAPMEDEVISYMESIGFYEVEELASHYDEQFNLTQRDVLFINKNL